MKKQHKQKGILVHYDREGETLSVWFGDSKKEVISEEIGGGVVLNKNAAGEVIGFEKLGFSPVARMPQPGMSMVELFNFA